MIFTSFYVIFTQIQIFRHYEGMDGIIVVVRINTLMLRVKTLLSITILTVTHVTRVGCA